MTAHPETAGEGRTRVMFLTIGRSPRHDMVPVIADQVGLPVEVCQTGILDNLSRQVLDELTATPEEPALLTYLTENIRVRLSRSGVATRLNALLAGFRPSEYDLVVLLATGFNEGIVSPCPLLNAHHAVEAALLSLVPRGSMIGIVHPLESQLSGNDERYPGYSTLNAVAGEGDRDGLLGALYDLADADAVLLASLSYAEADHATMARVTQKPVLLGRRILAGAIRLALMSKLTGPAPVMTQQTRSRLASLTQRESQILDLVCKGLSSKEIALALDISPKTVEVHRSHIMGKMGARSSGALISAVLGRGPEEENA